MTIGASNVNPAMHDPSEVDEAIQSGNLGSPILLEAIAALASGGMWRQLWVVADTLSREVSVLFDSEQKVWVDVGTAGKVRLKPPVGAKIPFRLWIHTHPWDAYWSSTDLATLASCSRILEEALVLGHDHLTRAGKAVGNYERLGPSGPLSEWTSEPVTTYDEWEESLDG